MTTLEASNNQSRYENETIALWQQRWVTSEKGRWTYAWFPDVRTRLGREWCTMDYFTTQLLSGHGDFNGKLHQFNLRGEAACRCGSPEQTAEHLLFECPTVGQEREKLKVTARTAGADWPCDPEFMTRSEVMFQVVKQFAKATLDRTDAG